MNIVEKLQRSLRRKRISRILMVVFSASVSLALVVGALQEFNLAVQGVIGFGFLLILLGIYFAAGSFEKPPAKEVTRYLDRTFPELEDSSSLLIREPCTLFEEWQSQKLTGFLEQRTARIEIPDRKLIRTASLSAVMLLFSSVFALTYTTGDSSVQLSEREISMPSEAEFVQGQMYDPAVQDLKVTITPSDYTGVAPRTEGAGNISAEEFSELHWDIETTGNVEKAELIFNDRSPISLEKNGSRFSGGTDVQNNQIYRVAVSSRDTTIYSEYYGISVISDNPPRFIFSSPSETRSMITDQNRTLAVDVEIVDDYGVTEASLNATLARGRGEMVRFRERTLHFDSLSGIGEKSARGVITLNADSLEMGPGDELYFYVTASDNHPETQTGRSQTYMMIYEDTTRSQAVMAGNIVVDLMPEDFRSQRQIIIDTENLIEEKENLSNEQFRTRSRRIGQDQQMLMLQFGQLLGLEDESTEVSAEIAAEADDHGHDHDHEVQHSHSNDETGDVDSEQSRSAAAAAIPHEFFHDHGDPDMNTLFADSPRALLRESLNQMWQASRYLQTDRPDEALPYEYRALEYLQQAQQAERRYVRRAGFEGIPIPVDEKRLTGTYDNFAAPKLRASAVTEPGPLAGLELMLREQTSLNSQQMDHAIETVQQAEIDESSKLYILNRLDRLQDSENDGSVRQEIISKLSELNNRRMRDPSPRRIPVPGLRGEVE